MDLLAVRPRWIMSTALTLVLLGMVLMTAWAARVSLPPLFGRVIVVDPGHGGIDSGPHDRRGLMEKDLNLAIALRLRKQLQKLGAFVVLTRDGDYELSYMSNRSPSRHQRDLHSRVLIAQRSQAELMLSIHINASGSPHTRGSIVFYQADSEASKRLARLIQEELRKVAPWHTQSPLAGRVYYILRTSPVVTALIEVGYLTNPEEKDLLCQAEYQEQIASAISTAVLRYFHE